MFLPAVAADYSHVTFNWWSKGANKTTLRGNAKDRAKIVGVIAATINSKPDEEWLVIHPMKQPGYEGQPGFCIESELIPMLTNPAPVNFLHWGLHLGRNDFRTIKNVVIVGSLHYGQTANEALYAAAVGKLTNLDQRGVKLVGDGEFVHHVYQAACRSNVRNIKDGVAGAATIYLITADRAHRAPLIAKAMPGCIIIDWEPVPKPPLPKERLMLETMARLFEASPISINLKELYLACGGKDSEYLKRMWTRPAVIAFMKENGIKKVGHRLVRYSAAKIP
ncbi:hypothetical protein ACFOD9_04305 [Novosphingobium bradum]|uniref:Uncharacterized protein n=1 Tax=Novosphingobium bradum TaxID=1737444 RepID=A0ABV7IRZ5_9SPHN